MQGTLPYKYSTSVCAAIHACHSGFFAPSLRERLIVLERKISDVKGELGLFRLAWHRVRKHARAILVAGTAVAGLLWARAAGMGPRWWIH